MTPLDHAQTLALQAVTYISQDDQMMQALLNQSGLTIDELKQNLANDEMLAGVIDFLLAHEEYLLDFADQNALDPQNILRARRHLPGGSFLWDG